MGTASVSQKGGFTLWLTVRLIRKQKLRTAAVFCGQLFSCFLLGAFGSLGYEFWGQVHPESSGPVEFDATRWILVSLVAVLLLVVCACAAVLLHNLFALTFGQRQRSLLRLVMLGAHWRTMTAVTVLEGVALYCPAALLGSLLTWLLQRRLGLRFLMPLWMWGGIGLFVLLLSLLCSLRPLCAAWSQSREAFGGEGFRSRAPQGAGSRRQDRKLGKMAFYPQSFISYMARCYYQANRAHYVRITLTVLSAIVLYVPASYLISTNLSVQQEGLDARYGIQYGCNPGSREETAASLQEYQRLSEAGLSKGSVVTVSMPGTAVIPREAISSQLLAVLWEAGWKEASRLLADSMVCFLEDGAYLEYLEGLRAKGCQAPGGDVGTAPYPAILVNRYINRASWSAEEQLSCPAVPALKEGAAPAGVEICYVFGEEREPDWAKGIAPDAITEEIPEEIDFTGSLLLILPLSRLEGFLSECSQYEGIQVRGSFEERSAETFGQLELALGTDSVGELRYTRRILQEWYDSMEGIHLAMNAICALLFSISVLNIFSMMVFQSLGRRRGLAILWSLGQEPSSLLRILIMEHMRSLWGAMVLGLPLSWGICYGIYRIFCRVWAVEYRLPLGQSLWILTAALVVTAAAILLDSFLMKGQDFLEGLKRDV